MSASEERIARNEALFREFNERVEDVAGAFDLRDEGDVLRIEFVCECGNLDCLDRIELRREAYEAVRDDARRFVVVPGHEDMDIARVVGRGEGYLVVEKVEEAAEVAIEHDPRS
ncbi:MAG: hypothetical protein E6G22_07620 [Actinobacteria bacterium]|nr:MAG: hypothetical protein E6G22_07620 [Actinomycetota bacterium]